MRLPLLAALSAQAAAQYTDPRSLWMLAVSKKGVPSVRWPALNGTEQAQFEEKAQAWYMHSTAHLQWGQAIPTVMWKDANMTVPLRYDDIGDTAAWTGQMLAALVHKYSVDGDSEALSHAGSILDGYDFATQCTGKSGYVPRSWALPDGSQQFAAWAAYFGAPAVNGSGSHNVYKCSAAGKENWLWQGHSSRDTYIGTLFGLGSAVMALKGKAAAAAELQTATRVFERIYDSLHAADFFLVPPKGKGLPVNPTPSFIAGFQRVALSVNPQKYGGADYGRWFDVSVATDSITKLHKSNYFGNNLLSMLWYLIARLELSDKSSKRAAALRKKMGSLTADYAEHLQANLNAYWAAASNDTDGYSGDIARALLWDFHSPPDPDHVVDQQLNPVYAPHAKCPHSCGCAQTALLVRDRPPDEYVWQRDPTKLAGGENTGASSPTTYFGGAFLTSYWVLRSAGAF